MPIPSDDIHRKEKEKTREIKPEKKEEEKEEKPVEEVEIGNCTYMYRVVTFCLQSWLLSHFKTHFTE